MSITVNEVNFKEIEVVTEYCNGSSSSVFMRKDSQTQLSDLAAKLSLRWEGKETSLNGLSILELKEFKRGLEMFIEEAEKEFLR